jgi:hypothetical protein
MVSRFIAAAFGTDRRAIETLGTALAGSRFVVTFATMALTPGRLATEGRPIPGCRGAPPRAPWGPPRIPSEEAALANGFARSRRLLA